MLFKPILKKLCITWATAIVVFVTGVCAAPVEESELVSSASIQWQTSDSLAVLGKGTVTNARSVLISTDSLFMGGISVNNQAFQRQVTQDLSDTVEIQGVISVDPADVGKTADIFVYIDAETASGRVDLVLSQDKILLWDGNLKNLVPMINNVSLAAVQPVAVYQGTFQATGHLRIYFGYGLADGTLVFNSQPLETTIEKNVSTRNASIREADKGNQGKSEDATGQQDKSNVNPAGKLPPGLNKDEEVSPQEGEIPDDSQDSEDNSTPSDKDPNLPPSGSNQDKTKTGKSEKVSPGKAKKISHNGAELDVGADAVSSETTLTIDSCDLPPLDQGMVNVTKDGQCFRFLPEGMKFKQKINVKIPYDKGLLPETYTEDQIQTYFYNQEKSHWQTLERANVDKSNQAINSKTDHFTDMINAVVMVPESPQTSSHVPTQFKDMKAADPATGINFIESPQANNMGAVNLGYPLEIPPGRVGMQPQIALSYNSGGGNGWVGVGWDLPLPAITVDTGWGVPHYYGDRESENYRINGELLTPQVHRDKLQSRTAEKEFFPRVVSQFRRIIRHGNHPSNYWWEITDKDGKVSYYGGDPTTGGPAADSTLTDGSGNVFSWALREVKDLNGNNIQYRCERVSSQGGFVSGVDLYLKTINYTGFNGQPGPYQVNFSRRQGRADATSSGRGGFMQVTADLLQKVEVTYQGQMIRSYELKYQSSPFSKSQLASVTQFGETGEAFNTHTFDYYDDISGTQGFASMIPWESGNDLGQNSAISVTQGKETGKNMSISAGLSAPVIGSIFSIGGNKSSSKSSSEGLLVLADINADGLPDKVFKQGGLVYYRPNLSGPNGINQFGEPHLIANLPEISKETSTSKSSGKSLNILIVKLGSSKSKTKTEQPVYFIDRNGDGLVDLAYNGTVWFNHRDANGNHYFSPNSADTPYPLGIAATTEPLTTKELMAIGPVTDKLTQEYATALQEFRVTSPLIDTVRRWQAPYDGQVSITGAVALKQDTTDDRQNYKTADGVRVVIQLNNTELWAALIAATDYAAKSPTDVDAFAVKKGDVIYFRVQSNDDGAYDQVQWNPTIQYTDIPMTLDANQFDVSRYEAAKDFTPNGGYQGTFVDMPYAGKVQLTGELKKLGATSDDVTIEVLKNGEVIDSQTLAGDRIGSIVLKQDIDVVAKDRLMVHVKLDSPIDLSKLQWNSENLPIVSYQSSEDPEIEQPVIGADGKPIYRYAIVSNYDVYPLTDVTTPLEAWPVPQSGTYTVKPLLAMTPGETTADSTLTLTVKRAGELVAKQAITVTNNVISNDTFTISATQDEKLYFELNTLNPELLTKLSQISAGVSGPSASNLSVPVALNSAEPAQMIAPPYRGWSAFGYNGDGERAAKPIQITATDLSGEELAKQTEALQTKYAEFAKKAEAIPQEDEAALEALEDEMEALLVEEDDLQKQFIIKPFLPDVEMQSWQGPDDGTWIHAETMSSSRDGLDYLDMPQLETVLANLNPLAVTPLTGDSSQSLMPDGVPNFAGATSISRTSRCESKTKSGGIGIGSLSASKSKTKSKCYGEDDMMDFNGDSFPDMLHVWGVQFTTMRGILGGQIFPWFVDGIRHTYAESKSKGMGGSGPKIGANSKGRTDNNACSAPGVTGSINLTASVSANKSKGTSDIRWDLLDLNGDGLIDRLDSDGAFLAALGIGYNFIAPTPWGVADINKGQNSSFDGGVGVDIGGSFGPIGGSIGGGVSVGSSESHSVRSLADANGDGALDIVWAEGSSLMVMFNTGSSFTGAVAWAAPGMSVSKGNNRGANASASVSVGFPIGPLSLGVSAGGGVSTSQNVGYQELQMATDINGDGYPDLLQSNSEGTVNVGLSQIGRTHLLKAVHNPLGGSYTIDYARTGNTYAQPHNRWVMAKVTINDGHPGDGVDEQVSTYQYLDGFYNRLERDFFGFKTVIESDLDDKGQVYRATTQTFFNDSYYNKGLLALQTVTDAAGNKWNEVENTYALRDVATNGVLANLNDLTAVVSPELRRTDKRFYEGQAAPGKATYETFEYDTVGNAIRYFNAQDAGTVDDIQADITYFNDVSKYLFIPQSISVTANGQVVRKREATIDASTGDVKQVRQYLADGQAATADIEYDVYGNILKMIGPMNAKGQRYTLSYTYDPAVNTYNTQVVDSFGYTSSATYNYKYGQAERTVDINNQPIETVLDQFGRVKTVTGPYQLGQSPYTLQFEYHPEAKPAWALTQHLDTYRDANDPIETVVFVDGLKRAIQTKKDATIHLGENGTSKDVMTVSGLVVYDFVGRALEQYYPITESLGQQGTFNSGKDSVQPTRLTYDVLDRNLCTTIPDNTQTCTSYGFGNDRNGQLQFLTQVTDANGKIKASYKDLREVITAVKEFNQGQTLWTSYEYDALKQILKVLDDKNNVTAATYDNLGRRLSLNNPDTGLVEWTYDLAGNVTQKVTANLRAQGGAIVYDYDFTRLNRIVYPQHPENNVTYTYGLPSAEFNRANRVVTVTDESGTEERFYGRLGEIVKTIKTVASDTLGKSANSPEIYTTEFEYDTWNRLQKLTYPDGEMLTHLYDSGGSLRALTGVKTGREYEYIMRLEYDKFDQRVFLQYGNKTRTHYTYNDANRRLISLKAGSGAGQGKLFQDLTYAYDNVGNILGQANLAATNSPSEMGGATQFQYQYDDLYRLVHAEGMFDTQPDKQHTYRLDMQYDSIHNILLKDQLHELKQPKTSIQVQKPTTYKFAYQYAGPQPHAPTHIGTKTYTYDGNGNQTGWTDDADGTVRIIDWDEENRIQRIIDNGNEKTYKYNDAGERVIKDSAQGETVYVNQFFVIRNGSVASKHVFAGSSRIVSKLAKQENQTIKGQNAGQTSKTSGPNEHQLYYYHPDHLGSSSYVTDSRGKVFQHLEYFPFGETWVEESSNTERTPYLFTSKELDEDTGLYYFGARYYDARTSVWASPDPILGSYLPTGDPQKDKSLPAMGVFSSPNLALYTYVANSPVKFVDPDGQLRREPLGNRTSRLYAESTNKFGYMPNGKGGQIEIFTLYTDNGDPIEAYQRISGDPSLETDCHGETFTNGKFWINDNQVDMILQGDNYIGTNNPQNGDVLIYRAKQDTYYNPSTDQFSYIGIGKPAYGKGDVVHSMTVTDVDRNTGAVTEVSGDAGVAHENNYYVTTPQGGWPYFPVDLQYYHKDP